jgi:hypothetical protein
VAPDSRTAYVTLQENNAIGILDIATASFTALLPLGGKDHNQPGYGLDASDRDNAIRIRPWPVVGMFQPDSIVAFQANGGLYLATANEGDAREYPGFEEEIRIGNAGYLLDPVQFPNAQTLKMNANLGRLRASIASGDLDGDGDYDQIHTFGARSITIWRPDGTLVFDSGDAFEQLIAGLFPAHFNASNDSHAFDGRSPSKGPEPEGLAVGRVFGQRFGRTLLFVGLERIGGVVVYDVTYPESPLLVRYVNTRNFGAAPGSAAAGDLGPEGLLFIPEERSPNGHPLLVVGNEVSGTTTLFQIVRVEEESP